jgi:O-antigen ligase
VIGNVTGHNGYLDVYVELGFIGILLLSVFLIGLFRRVARLARYDFEWAILGMGLLVISLAFNYTESEFLSVFSPLWTVILLMSFGVSMQRGVRPENLYHMKAHDEVVLHNRQYETQSP